MDSKKLIEKELITLAEFRKYMFYPVYPIGDIRNLQNEPMSLSFPFWRKNGLMPFIPKGSRNTTISFAQLIWLRILDHLRALGYSINETRIVCDRLFKDAHQEDLSKKNIEFHFSRLKKKEFAGTLDADERELLSRLSQILQDSILLNILKFEFNFLTDLIVWTIENNEELALQIYPGGRVVVRKGIDLAVMGDPPDDFNSPHIYLSITYFLKEFIQADELKLIHIPGLLNENEKKVLIALREKDVHELIIKVSDSEIMRIDSKSINTLTSEKAKKIKLAIGLGDYEEITLATRDKNSLTFKKTKKILLPGNTGRK
jgi:DNA-binding transcriptional MerR regulator